MNKQPPKHHSLKKQKNEIGKKKRSKQKPFLPRTEEETHILSVIIYGLVRYSRLWFDQLQNALKNDRRISSFLNGRQEFRIYTVKELSKIIAKSYAKLSIEASTDTLKGQWTAEDKQLWERLQILEKIIAREQHTTLLRGVNSKIRGAAREYFAHHPEKNEPYWLV